LREKKLSFAHIILKLKNKKKLVILSFPTIFICLSVALILVFKIGWFNLDYRILDILYKYSTAQKTIEPLSDRIVQIFITDETHNKIGSNKVSRSFYAKLNKTISKYRPNSIMYDIIFSQKGNATDDSLFRESLIDLPVYLPIAFRLSLNDDEISKEKYNDIKEFHLKYLGSPEEINIGKPYTATDYISQLKLFQKESYNNGHISITKDTDGILRHHPIIIRVSKFYFPTTALSIFLDYINVPFDSIKINWGNYIYIPTIQGSYNGNDITIPIDVTGSIYIPYTSFWEEYTLRSIEATRLIDISTIDEYYDDLLNLFEGNFIFISDMSTGSTDLGETPLERNVPLVVLHTSILNALLNETFFSYWDFTSISIIVLLLGLLVMLFVVLQKNLILYVLQPIVISILVVFTYYEFINFRLFPVFTVSVTFLILSLVSIATLHYLMNKERKFIKNAFSKYVAPQFVNKLINDETALKLSGEEREITVLFSDIANFTKLSENTEPPILVSTLNEYFSVMSEVIINNKGIIDKFVGDCIMCEFGLPVNLKYHADYAVTTGLIMLKKLKKLNLKFENRNIQKINCRIGINTGNAIIGNMGSEKLFDYTAIGDTINIASRVEQINKVYGTRLLITNNTFEQLTQENFRIRFLDKVLLKGKSVTVEIYEVYGFGTENMNEKYVNYYKLYEKGIKSYLNGNNYVAKQYFTKALNIKNDDKASLTILERIDKTYSS